MSMTDTGSPAGGTEGTVEPTTQAPAPGTETGSEGQAQAEGGSQVETFDRAYVEKLRQEAAGHRTRAKQYEEAFEGYSPEQQQYLFKLVRGLNDPNAQKATAAEWKEIAEKILNADGPTLPNGDPDPDAQPLTRKEWEKLQEERESKNSQAQAIKEIEREAAELGFPPAPPGDTDGIRYSMLLSAAQHPEVAGDLKKAAERVKAYEKSVIDAHASSLQQNAERFPGTAGTAPNTGAQAPATERPNWKNARAAALEFLNAKAGEA